APGVSIMAAVATTSPGSNNEFNFLSGTSMSSPHNAGAGALIAGLTDWSPYEIRSALMMTAHKTNLNRKEDGATPADPFDVGAGRIDLARVLTSGLVLDETEANFIAADPAAGGDPKTLNLASMQNSRCVGECSFTRTFKNVSGGHNSWEVRATTPSGMNVDVTPRQFGMAEGATETISFTVDAASAPRDWNFAEIELLPKYNGPTLRMPMAIRASDSSAPGVLSHSVSNDAPFNGDTVNVTIDVANGVIAGPVAVNHQIPDNMQIDFDSMASSLTRGTELRPFEYNFMTNSVEWEGTLAPSGLAINESPSPFGFFALSRLGVAPNGCPSNCDDGAVIIEVPAFQFNGQTYTEVIWSVNGTLEVGTASGRATSFANQNLPNPTPPNNLLAPFWTDLNMGSDGDGSEWYHAVLTAGSRRFSVFEWSNIPLFGTTNTQTSYSFQIWIENGPSGNIWFVYGGLNGPLPATVGVENADGTIGGSHWFEGTGTAPAVGTDLQVVRTPGGQVTLTYSATAKDCPQGGKRVVSSVQMANAGSADSAIDVLTCSKQ
ncbi:MAG: S8 family serine peptidase, partial [Myxococcota bacterium]